MNVEKELENLGFKFDEKSSFWFHEGNVNIERDFRPNVNIYIKGHFDIDGYGLFKNLIVTNDFVAKGLSVENFYGNRISIAQNLIGKKVIAKRTFYVLGDIDVTDIICFDKLIVYGSLSALNIEAKKFILKGNVDCKTLKNIDPAIYKKIFPKRINKPINF